MKLQHQWSAIERFNIGAESVFTIKTSPLAFNILSSALYTDKIMAIVRELSCNAYDAHISVNKSDIPFDVHLPSPLEPKFSIRDYGPGLSNSDVHTLYTAYFDSTKMESNSFIGALGLGSKSPFSYTKSFTVVSRHKGVKSAYIAFINEGGIPTISDINSIPTDDPDGLEIIIAVDKPMDHALFRDRLRQAFLFFPVKANVLGTLEQVLCPYPLYELLKDFSADNKFHIMKNIPWHNYPRNSVVQGNVWYPLNTNLLDGLSEQENNLLENMKTVFFFDIGMINVSASREGIQYDKATKKVLEDRARELIDNLSSIIVVRALKEHKDSYWKLVAFMNGSINKLGLTQPNMLLLFKSAMKSITDEEADILSRLIENNGQISVDKILLSNSIEEHNIIEYTVNAHKSTLYSSRETICNRNRGPEEYTKDNLNLFRKIYSIHPGDQRVVMYNDIKLAGVRTALEYAIENRMSYIYLITKKQKSGSSEAVNSDKETILKLLGNPPVIYLKDLLPAEIKTSKRSSLGYFRVYSINETHNKNHLLDRLNMSQETFNEGGYYIPVISSEKLLQLPGGRHITFPSYPRRKIMSVVHLMNSSGILDKDVLHYESSLMAVPKTLWKRFSKSKNWINLLEIIEANRESLCLDLEKWIGVTGYRMTEWKSMCADAMFLAYFNALDETSVFRKELEPLKDMVKFINDKAITDLHITNAHDYFLSCKYIINTAEQSSNKIFNKDKIVAAYPLFDLMNLDRISYSLKSRNSSYVRELFKYLMAADKCRVLDKQETKSCHPS